MSFVVYPIVSVCIVVMCLRSLRSEQKGLYSLPVSLHSDEKLLSIFKTKLHENMSGGFRNIDHRRQVAVLPARTTSMLSSSCPSQG